MADVGLDDKPVVIQDPFGNEVTVMLSSVDLWVERQGYKKVNGQVYSLDPNARAYSGNKSAKADKADS